MDTAIVANSGASNSGLIPLPEPRCAVRIRVALMDRQMIAVRAGSAQSRVQARVLEGR
jgi:hypothetical protein